MSHELVLDGIFVVNKLSSSLNWNSIFSEFTEQDFGFKLEYAPKTPPPLPFMCILDPEESLESTASTAPPELYMFVSPIGAN